MCYGQASCSQSKSALDSLQSQVISYWFVLFWENHLPYRITLCYLPRCHQTQVNALRLNPSQIVGWSSAYFSRYCDSKISQIWLKTPIQAPKNHVLGGFDPQTLFFIIKTHKRGYLTQKHAFWTVNGRDQSSGVTCRHEQEYKKRQIEHKK